MYSNVRYYQRIGQLPYGRLYKLGRVDFEDYCEEISHLL